MNKEIILKLKNQGVSISAKCRIYKNADIKCEHPVSLSNLETNMVGNIGAFSFIRGGRVSGALKSIGRYCSISTGLTAGDSNHVIDWLSTHPFQHGGGALLSDWNKNKNHKFLRAVSSKVKESHIGNDVWIGSNVTIMPGVTIGDGAIVQAGSVVTKNVQPYAIVSGVPAKVDGFRFDENIISELLKLRWWRFEADSLLGVSFDDVITAINQIKKLEVSGRLELIDRKSVSVSGSELNKKDGV